MKQAKVYRNDDFAGILTEFSRNNYTFKYDEAYFADASKPAISLTLPKTSQEYQSEVFFPFFFNMLSEGVNKQLQSQLLKIDENDSFSLLLETGQYDTIGAITLKPIEKE